MNGSYSEILIGDNSIQEGVKSLQIKAAIEYLNESSLNLKLKKCEKYYLAKKYNSLEELSSDNDVREVFAFLLRVGI